jgi:VanZ family protein
MTGSRLSRRDSPALAIAGLLLVTSLVPLPETGNAPTPSILLPLDAWAHLLGYAALAGLLARGRSIETTLGVVAVVSAAVAYGGAIELLQGLVATRTTSLVDGIVNGVGATVGAALWFAADQW